MALVVAVLPASAGEGAPSGNGIPPAEIDWGGGPGACDFIESDAAFSLEINNPQDQLYTIAVPGEPNAQFDISGLDESADKFYDFVATNMAVRQVITNGGSKSVVFDYTPGAAFSDTELHAPTRGGSDNPFSVSWTTVCFDIGLGSVSGMKWHDHDTDGVRDLDGNEPGLGGWLISAFDEDNSLSFVGSATTAADGSYSLTLPAGTYTICEEATGPDTGEGPAFSWAQSAPPGMDCDLLSAGGVAQAAGGHTGVVVVEDQDNAGWDFGNHLEVTVTCGTPVTLSGGPGEPSSTVDCSGKTSITSAFDLGLSDDAEEWSQFVVFGGEPSGDAIVTQSITWAPEDAVYTGDPSDPLGPPPYALQVPETLVRLIEGGALQPIAHCDPGPAFPSGVSDCLINRIIYEEIGVGGASIPEQVQLVENYQFRGDPPRFR